jgi:hypothetical protein
MAIRTQHQCEDLEPEGVKVNDTGDLDKETPVFRDFVVPEFDRVAIQARKGKKATGGAKRGAKETETGTPVPAGSTRKKKTLPVGRAKAAAPKTPRRRKQVASGQTPSSPYTPTQSHGGIMTASPGGVGVSPASSFSGTAPESLFGPAPGNGQAPAGLSGFSHPFGTNTAPQVSPVGVGRGSFPGAFQSQGNTMGMPPPISPPQGNTPSTGPGLPPPTFPRPFLFQSHNFGTPTPLRMSPPTFPRHPRSPVPRFPPSPGGRSDFFFHPPSYITGDAPSFPQLPASPMMPYRPDASPSAGGSSAFWGVQPRTNSLTGQPMTINPMHMQARPNTIPDSGNSGNDTTMDDDEDDDMTITPGSISPITDDGRNAHEQQSVADRLQTAVMRNIFGPGVTAFTPAIRADITGEVVREIERGGYINILEDVEGARRLSAEVVTRIEAYFADRARDEGRA